MARQVLHADFIALSDRGERNRDALIDSARELLAIESVVTAVAIEGGEGSDFELAFLFVLRDFTALEPFGTDARYSRFLQGRIAPVLTGLAGADIQLEGDFPTIGAHAACLGLAAPPETYDWEVRDQLAGWSKVTTSPLRAYGLAVGERQRYRGLAVAFGTSPLSAARPVSNLGATLIAGRSQSLA
jgi:hypothetical protein